MIGMGFTFDVQGPKFKWGGKDVVPEDLTRETDVF
jgi:hypothetical protein